MANLIQRNHIFLASGHDPMNVAYMQGQLARYMETARQRNPYTNVLFRGAWDEGWERAHLDIREDQLERDMQ